MSGHAYREIGERGDNFQMTSARDCANRAAMYTFQDAYKTYQGKFVTLTDVHGEEHENILVKRVDVIEMKAIAGAGGGLETNPTHHIRAIWTFQDNDL